jgi:hypothetical protein
MVVYVNKNVQNVNGDKYPLVNLKVNDLHTFYNKKRT